MNPTLTERCRPPANVRSVTRRCAVRTAGVAILYAALLPCLLLIGKHQSYPGDSLGMQPSGGGLGVAANQMLGRGPETDFLLDYAGAFALTHDDNAYDIGATLTERVGHPWPVSTANTHPPTLLTLVLPLTWMSYPHALAAWALAMVFVVVGTLWLAGVRTAYAIPAGIATCLTFPGAYGIGNPVPVIAFGMALAYRCRHKPWLAGIGLMLAAAPKLSGVLIFLPFLASRRLRAVLYGAASMGIVAFIPMLWDRDVWSRYLDTGVEAGRLNAARDDNASLLNLADKWHVPKFVAVAIVVFAAIVMVRVTRDFLRPTIWLTVASLPIAWHYALLTFIPLWWWTGRRVVPRTLALAAIGLTLACPPLGRWSVVMFPIIVLLTFAAVCMSAGSSDEETQFARHDFGWNWRTPSKFAQARSAAVRLYE